MVERYQDIWRLISYDFWEKRIGEKELEQKLERKMRGK